MMEEAYKDGLDPGKRHSMKTSLQGPMAAAPVDATLFSGKFNFEFLPFAVTSDVGPQFIEIAAIEKTQV